ncbi:MAG TPA: 6-hydroxycyclohex-1-ene-1-carbonyl-CoA dehydrogenase [Candidatus Polarisedimenticolia bacterium]|nr:6-hydroxycyclohex-1-ene-1-carbonyl-CoA dehydrogenase [Candidatus Polarisedimenticolia bacterium]
MEIQGWMVRSRNEPMTWETRDQSAGKGEVTVRVEGCGVCHTDLGFFYEGVPTRKPFPLTLGHEVSGTVVQTGDDTSSWMGRQVIVPAVIPCGRCQVCRDGHGSICPRQTFPGCDVHGGFATHLIVPAHGLCPVPDLGDQEVNRSGVDLASLSVVADAVSTPYQAILRSGLKAGDLAVFVGVGGVGGFGAQIAAALGAHVAAIDVSAQRLALMARHGCSLTLRADQLDAKGLKAALKSFAEARDIPTYRQKIFETSGTTQGQTTAFGLLGHGGYLAIVGFTAQKIELRLSNLMAMDATAQGNWGCLPEHYPAVVDLILSGKVALGEFLERRPLATINEVFPLIHERKIARRVILVPQE